MTLEEIKQNIENDPDNGWAIAKGWHPVYTADSRAKILIAGQAPGIRAQESGLPWNDKSGDNLRSWIGVSRETFYDPRQIALIPMDFFFPGSTSRGDIPPRPHFAPKWHPLLLSLLPDIQLKILVGQYSQRYYLGSERKKTLSLTVRHYQDYLPEKFPLVHPSPLNNIWHKNNLWFKKEVLPVLKEEVAKILD